MDAWFSGSLQQALIKEKEIYYLLCLEPEAKAVLIDQTKVSTLTRDWQDAYFLVVQSPREAFLELHNAVLRYDALLAASLAIDKGVAAIIDLTHLE
jgi:hypothetical protein